jgi:EAL domain-containing protein (putative c-di-GMP-specific phosphodiesterase class I)
MLELEITESAVMVDPAGALNVLSRLRDFGIPLYIDDFGTGYSSLSYLKRLPMTAMKIDRSFVSDMLEDANSASIVRSTIALAHELGLEVVAEGVENEPMWAQLQTLGCDSGQGYYMGRPMPAGKIVQWLRESPWGLTR